MSVMQVELPEVAYRYGALVFKSTVCDVQTRAGTGWVNTLLADTGSEHDLHLGASQARSLAAALLAAADASEATA